MVLGLTMAEVLLLLLFLLLLALTGILRKKEHEATLAWAEARQATAELAAVKPIVEAAAQSGGLQPELASQLSRQLAGAAANERELEAARRESAKLRSTLAAEQERAADWQALAAEARQINPDAAPAATLRRALSEARQKLNSPNAPGQPGQRETVSEVVVAIRDAERRLAQGLRNEFAQDLTRWNATLDSENLTLRFEDPEILFEPGKADLRPSFEALLSNFIPRYLKKLKEFESDIQEVRIEGHTSSEWRGATGQEAYFRNMALSQDRTRTALEYGLTRTGLAPETRDWARRVITANGLSSSRPILKQDGLEDPVKSRRVEFRVLMKLRENVMRVIGGRESNPSSR
jgi:hypothetical protein